MAAARLPRWRRRRVVAASGDARAIEPAKAEDDAEVARQAVDAALVPLREPADPRAAVIEAYVRMEQVLAERQLGRRAPEAPREYLRACSVSKACPNSRSPR